MHTLFRKKGVSKEEKAKYGAVPEWACLGKWTDIGKERVHYAAPVYPATSGDVGNMALRLCLKVYSKKQSKAAAETGWIILHALREEVLKREALEKELIDVKGRLIVATECLLSNNEQNACLEEQCATLRVDRVNHRRPVGKLPMPSRRMRPVIKDSPRESSSLISFSDEEEDFVENNYESPDDVPDRRKVRPVITQQRKRRVNRDQYGNAGEAHDEVNELMRGYTQMELSELAKAYKQGSDESMGEWLLRVWDAGADKVMLNATEAVSLGQITNDPQVRQILRQVREIQGNFSLLDIVRHALLKVFPSHVDIEPHTPWRTLKEAIVHVRIMGCLAGLDKGQM
ncbi:Hypothetical predicted protein [Pelobates cultripes]|uniref:Uncharacterized protein n=1 Tax=Pelobates cultripes TaxID=61616 RepID=A0AAD1RRI9_PELCU|nr:Hypothetical predicted protein [Pelobates cultripes]